MRSRLGPLVVLACFVTGAALCLPVGAPTIDETTASPAQTATATPASGCTAYGWKAAAPLTASVGQAVTLTLRVEPRCWYTPPRLHVVFVLDASDSMYDMPILFQNLAAKELARTLALGASPGTQAAVVSYAGEARLETPLTDDDDRVMRAIERTKPSRRAADPTRPDGNTRIDLGIREGLRALRKGREGIDPNQLREVMWIMGDGVADGGCASARREAAQASREGILTFSVCVTTWCDDRCLEALATTERESFQVGDLSRIRAALEQVIRGLGSASVTSLVVTDTLGADVILVPGSPRPAPARLDPLGQWLTWQTGPVTAGGVAFTMQVRPRATGRVPTNVEATGLGQSNVGVPFPVWFPVPYVDVSGPTVPASATATEGARQTAAPPTRMPASTTVPTTPTEQTRPRHGGANRLFIPCAHV